MTVLTVIPPGFLTHLPRLQVSQTWGGRMAWTPRICLMALDLPFLHLQRSSMGGGWCPHRPPSETQPRWHQLVPSHTRQAAGRSRRVSHQCLWSFPWPWVPVCHHRGSQVLWARARGWTWPVGAWGILTAFLPQKCCGHQTGLSCLCCWPSCLSLPQRWPRPAPHTRQPHPSAPKLLLQKGDIYPQSFSHGSTVVYTYKNKTPQQSL